MIEESNQIKERNDSNGISEIKEHENGLKNGGAAEEEIKTENISHKSHQIDTNGHSNLNTSLDSNFPDLNKRTKMNKQMDLNTFFKQRNHFFIMTDGGKPIFSRYGDEVENCGILATFSAMITKFTFFNNSQNNIEKLHYISTEKTTTVFLKKGKLVFISLLNSKESPSSISFMTSQLEYLYIQLLSIVTADRMIRLEDNPSYCNSALADTDEIFEQMITYTNNTLASFLNSFHSLVLDSNTRSRLYSICNENRGEALLCVLLTPYEVIVISKNEAIPSITAHDIVLIQNLIFSSESLRMTESWVPICLPGISDAGYLQIYINFIEPNIGLVFITESQEHSYFLKFSEQSSIIYNIAQKENLIENIKQALDHKNKSKTNRYSIANESEMKYKDTEKIIEDFFLKLSHNGNSSILTNTHLTQRVSSANKAEITNNPSITSHPIQNSNSDPFTHVKFVVCKSKTLNQYFSFRFNDFYKVTPEEKGVLMSYCNLFDVYNSPSLSINPNSFFYYEKDQHFTHVIQTNESYILFCSFNFFKELENIHHLTLEILKLIKFKESYFFIKY